MALPPIGYDELVYIQTDKLNVSIKGKAVHPMFPEVEYKTMDSELRVVCREPYELSIRDGAVPCDFSENKIPDVDVYRINPLFFEQQQYEIIIEASDGHQVSFWHDNQTIRNKVTKTGRHHELWSGVINFGNEIGLSDLVIGLDGAEYLRLVIEVFPSKISYKEDYKCLVEDVTAEIYNIVFDFLKKTYLGYQQSERTNSSPVEFFAVIRKIYEEFLGAVDMVLLQPHHLLETTHEVLPSHKIKRIDSRTRRWLELHPEQVKRQGGTYTVANAMAAKKQVTYDTKENRFIKYILQSTIKKLDSFKKNYLRLQRNSDPEFVLQIDSMIKKLNRRVNNSFFMKVNASESSCGISLVFSMGMGYRELYKYYLMLLRGLSISGDVFHISVKDVALLYEYWCFIKLNSLLKTRYELISQDIVRAQGNGLFVTLVKGKGSQVRYQNPANGEIISLSYNPKSTEVPTVAQRPDNVLSLEKKGSAIHYEYIFDAKYRINPAEPGTVYYNTISHIPGPEVEDINTMHRYRDAIVYQKGGTAYEKLMFGAYVLFPYKAEEEYLQHRFYKSIDTVNIGGLPFLPSATKCVSTMLDELILESPESAFERATLPIGTEEKLSQINWKVRDVLVGGLRNRAQLGVCLEHGFYHIPASQIADTRFPIRYVAIYQSKYIFGDEAGIRYYGEVTKCYPVRRNEIKEIPSPSDKLYYKFEIKEWKTMVRPIVAKELRFVNYFTNLFLLEHSTEIPELRLRSEEEYRLYMEIKRAVDNAEIDDTGNDLRVVFHDDSIVFEDGKIRIYKNEKLSAEYEAVDFKHKPGAVFRKIHRALVEGSS